MQYNNLTAKSFAVTNLKAPMSKSQTMSEIIAEYNAIAQEQGKEEVSSFKNLSAARAALKSIQTTESEPMNETVETETETETEAPVNNTSGPKYNSAGKRGPTQGIGAFCKGLIAKGKTNTEILEAVAEQFPTAKTTANCIAYYRAKVKLAAATVEADDAADAMVEEATEEATAE